MPLSVFSGGIMCRFKESIAVKFGVNAAIVAQFIWDSIKQGNYDGKEYFRSGRKWCRCSVLMMTGFFPFLSRRMAARAISVLVNENVLQKGCFNENRFDHTNWYTFSDYGSYLMREGDVSEQE